MGSKPITAVAKMKSYENSVAKKSMQEMLISGHRAMSDSKDVAATYNSTNPGGERKVTTQEEVKVRKPYVGAENDACSSEYIAKHGDAACKEYNNLSDEQKDAANFDTEIRETTSTVKDPDETFTGNLYAAQSGTATSSFRGRSDRRNVKATTKDQYRNQVRNLRSRIGSDILDEDGNPTGEKYTRKQFKKDKQSARTQMFENRQKAFDNQQENLQRQIEQGRIKGESYRRPDRVKTRGDYGDDAQIQMGIAQQKADKLKAESSGTNIFSTFLENMPSSTIDFTPKYSYKSPITDDKKVSNFNSLMYPNNSNYGSLGSGIQKRGNISQGYKMKGFGSKNKK